jgi:hypothetical protein
MIIRAAFLVVAFVLASIPAHAQPPVPGPPTGGLNLVTLAGELAALRARVERLESGTVTAADLVGRWILFAFGLELGGNPPGTPAGPGAAPAFLSPGADVETRVPIRVPQDVDEAFVSRHALTPAIPMPERGASLMRREPRNQMRRDGSFCEPSVPAYWLSLFPASA